MNTDSEKYLTIQRGGRDSRKLCKEVSTDNRTWGLWATEWDLLNAGMPDTPVVVTDPGVPFDTPLDPKDHERAMADDGVPGGQPDPRNDPSTADRLYFYEKKSKYYEFANFYPCHRLTIDGQSYYTTEHYFQCSKLKFNRDLFNECTSKQDPMDVFNYPKNIYRVIDQKWQGDAVQAKRLKDQFKLELKKRDLPPAGGFYGDDGKPIILYPWNIGRIPNYKDYLMYKVLHSKFSQDKRLLALLLSTGDAVIVEHSPYDDYWGDKPCQQQKKVWDYSDNNNHLGQMLMVIRYDLNPANANDPDVIRRKKILGIAW